MTFLPRRRTFAGLAIALAGMVVAPLGDAAASVSPGMSVYRAALRAHSAQDWTSERRFSENFPLRLHVFVDGEELDPHVASGCSAFYAVDRVVVAVRACDAGPLRVMSANADDGRHRVRMTYVRYTD